MTRENVGLDDLERGTEKRQPAPPAPVQSEQLAWASAVGNQAVQRLARSAAVARQPAEEEQAPVEEEEQAAEASPEGEPEATQEELPEDELPA